MRNNIIAAAILGICILGATIIMSYSLASLGDRLVEAGSRASSDFPSTITIQTTDGQPLVVKQVK